MPRRKDGRELEDWEAAGLTEDLSEVVDEDTGTSSYTFSFGQRERHGWVFVEGGDLPQPVELKVGRRGTRLTVLGLRVDNSSILKLEIDARTLRSIKLGHILQQLGAGYTWPRDDDGPPTRVDVATEARWLEDIARDLGASGPAKQGKAPDDQQLRGFVEVYRRELKTDPRRAMTTSTRLANMARSTGYRWLRLAQERGLYNQEDQ